MTAGQPPKQARTTGEQAGEASAAGPSPKADTGKQRSPDATSSELQPVTWPELVATLMAGNDLSRGQTRWAMDQVMSGLTSPVVLAGFLVALSTKGETVTELGALAEEMLAHAVAIEVPSSVVDVVGTGGDRARTVNISTMAALVVAGLGVPVVKHGNRAASSASGSADVLEALGVRLDLTVDEVAKVFFRAGITFCFAQTFHPSMRHAATARAELGVGTAFNVLGPLTNPARPQAAAIGVANPRVAPLIAGVLADRGTRALVFRGEDGLDELSPTAPAQIWEVSSGEVRQHLLDPAADLGIPRATISDLRGADAAFNARVAHRVFSGEPGPIRDAVVLNAAAALVADGRLTGTDAGAGSLLQRMSSAIQHAATALDDGGAVAALEGWVRASDQA